MTAAGLTPDRPTTAYLLKLPPALLAQARAQADKEGRTLANWIRQQITKGVAPR